MISMWSRSWGTARCWRPSRLTLRSKSYTTTLSVCQEKIYYVLIWSMWNAGCPPASSHISQCAASMFFWLFWPTTVTYVTVCCVNTNRAERAQTSDSSQMDEGTFKCKNLFLCTAQFHAMAATDIEAAGWKFKELPHDKAVSNDCTHTAGYSTSSPLLKDTPPKE